MLKNKVKALYFLVLGFKESNYNDACIYLEQSHKLFYPKKLQTAKTTFLTLEKITPKTYNNGL